MTAGCRNTPYHPRADAAELIRARTLWDLLRIHGPMLLGAAVQTANGALSRVEQIKRFAIVPVSWNPGGYEITLTIKLKRHAIVTKYAESSRPVRQAWRDGTSRRS